ASGQRRLIAILSALMVRCRSWTALTAHPTRRASGSPPLRRRRDRPDARTAVRSATPFVRGRHQHAQLANPAGVLRARATLPGVEAAARDVQTATEDRDCVMGLLRGDEPLLASGDAWGSHVGHPGGGGTPGHWDDQTYMHLS